MKKTDLIQIKIEPEVKQQMKRAALLEGYDLSNWARGLLVRETQKVLVGKAG